MSDHGLLSSEIRSQHADAIALGRSFKTHGVSEQAAKEFLRTDEGLIYQQRLIEADPAASAQVIRERAILQTMSGQELPRMELVSEPLVKAVPSGTQPTPYTPFFGKESDFLREVAAGARINERFGLPIASEAPVYDLYRIVPRVPTEVFVSTVAPTSELGGAVTRTGGATQYLVPNRNLFSEAVRVSSLGNDLSLHESLSARRSMGASVASAGESGARTNGRSGLAKTVGTAGLALTAYDALTTSARSDALRDQGSVLAAQSELSHFAGRNIGGWAGAAAGAELGLATFGKTPQTAIIGGVVGGVIGSVAGERIADREDAKKIYTQVDKDGVQWRLAGQQWEREELADLTQDAAAQPQRRSFSALPEKTSELNYRATNAAVDLASRDQPSPANPFKLGAGAEDRASLQRADWQRDPRGDGWYRDIVSRVEAPDIPVFEREIASPARAKALDAESTRTIASNIANSPSATAARYEAAYRSEGWDRHGPMPTQITSALAGADTLTASNGLSYVRGADAAWRHEGAVASGNLERELELTRDALLPALAQHADAMSHVSARAALSPEAQDRSNLTSTYAAFGIDPNVESMDAILLAVERTRVMHGLDRSTTSLSPKPDNDGRYSIHSPIDHLVRHEGVVRVAATTTAEDIQRARDDQTTHREPSIEPRAKAPPTDQRAPGETPGPLGIPLGDTSAKETPASPFATSNHPQHALYALLKDNLPQGTSERRLAQFTAECHRGGIGPRSLASIEIAGEHAAFATASGWPRVDVSISASPPSIEESAMRAQEQSLRAQTDAAREMPQAQAMHH
ncbi:hypothetical protein [Luteimonas sp. 3794]|uniref:hypothetical protein n=1 Tax=Luteimonas sp. 3794 TaxID=2817730 RepID=UPI0028629663|nr:hypothetical protein [Luteimonas sp. 3794]MDR6991652.1 hypothetical protein [Luteimonas sp. 3794]